ncbi:MAG TPA: hypothetical protein VMH90_04185 [Thermoplasmata archaeon]|nr:hypothetical protein [Thermoplasmata archaeon]
MEIKHVGHKGTSLDPTADAVEMIGELVSGASTAQPTTPELLWKELARRGFYFMSPTYDGRLARLPEGDPAAADWGPLYAGLLLGHALAKGLIGGNAETRQYWPRS